jgi:hypothetical protein
LTHHASAWRLANGETNQAATGAEIYRWLDDEALAQQYEDNEQSQRTWARNGRIISWTGWASVAAGAGLFAAARYGSIDAGDPSVAHCQDFIQSAVQENCRAQQYYEDSSGRRVLSYSLAGAGLIAGVVGAIIRSRSLRSDLHPVSSSRAKEMVEDKNQSILDGDDQLEENTDAEEETSFYMTPYFTPGTDSGAGVRLGFTW